MKEEKTTCYKGFHGWKAETDLVHGDEHWYGYTIKQSNGTINTTFRKLNKKPEHDIREYDSTNPMERYDSEEKRSTEKNVKKIHAINLQQFIFRHS